MPAELTLLEVPFDAHSSFRRGTALGPARIIEALYCDSTNLWTENGLDLGSDKRWRRADAGLGRIEDYEEIETRAARILADGTKLVALGGDHSISWPLIRAHVAAGRAFDILHLDAHPDLYDQLDGNRHSHASPFARIGETYPQLAITQVGIRTATGHQREQARRFGVTMIEMKDIRRVEKLIFSRPLYLSLDLDCLDPAFAPGVSHHEPGGMSTRQVLSIIQSLDVELIGADIVEYNPERDVGGMTAMVAAKMLKEIMAKMLG